MKKHLEDNLQEACIKFFRLSYPGIAPLLFSIPNGGRRDAREAARLKRQGVTPGVPDLFLSVPTKFFHGAFFELKIGKNILTENQKDMIYRLESQGYACFIIKSIDEFLDKIKKYLA
jgi:hypothetical protein